MSQLVAIITGAGRGIGRATAVELSRRGYAVSLVARSVEELSETAVHCPASICVKADITSSYDIDRILEATIQKFGRIDALINNAGLAPMASIERTTLEQFRQVLDVNLTATFALSRACWPHFLKQKSGVIVNVSSMAAKDPLPGFAAYGPAKAGVNILGLVMAREGAAHGIRVHTIAPGSVETQMFRSLIDEKTWPKEKTLPPEEVAKMIASCVTGELKYTSGEVIYIRREPA